MSRWAEVPFYPPIRRRSRALTGQYSCPGIRIASRKFARKVSVCFPAGEATQEQIAETLFQEFGISAEWPPGLIADLSSQLAGAAFPDY
jgi:hypothetical protein